MLEVDALTLFGVVLLFPPAPWEVVLSLRGDTSERHCEKASCPCKIARGRHFVSMRVPISDVLCTCPDCIIFCCPESTADRRFVFECRFMQAVQPNSLVGAPAWIA